VRRILSLLSLVLLLAGHGWCGQLLLEQPDSGQLSLRSTEVYNGEVAVLEWRGEPLSFGVVRFRDSVYSLYPDPLGAIALLPVSLDTPAGDYTISAALADRQGQTTLTELILSVRKLERPLERLDLPERMVTPDRQALDRIVRERERLQGLYERRRQRRWTTFQRPVDDPVSSVFGKRRLLNGKPRAAHSGTDFRSPGGTPVHALSNGRVVLVDELFYTGNTVVVDHGEGLFSIYAHLASTEVRVGDELIVGEVLGQVGSTGRSTGNHLHLTVRLLGERVDLMALLSAFDGG
jgi:murein DD-endopeptidase MepM/ murein hydrolase activator NlpD